MKTDYPSSSYSSVHSIQKSTRTVFSNWKYIVMAGTIAMVFWIVFNVFDQLLFFSPILTFYIPNDAVIGFILSTTTSILLGIVVSMNVYALKNSKIFIKKNNDRKTSSDTGNSSPLPFYSSILSLLSGSSISVASSMCISCSASIAIFLVSIFGGSIGTTLSSFLSEYHIPLRLFSIALLGLGFYSVSKKIDAIGNMNCTLNK